MMTGGAVYQELLSELINPQWKSFGRGCQISRAAPVVEQPNLFFLTTPQQKLGNVSREENYPDFSQWYQMKFTDRA